MKIVYLLIFFLLALSLTPTAFAQNHFRKAETVTVPKNEVIYDDFFAWGEKIVFSGMAQNDIYLVGGNIIVDGNIEGDLLAAGGNINILGNINGDLRVVGGNITISGDVSGNVSAAGGSVQLTNSARVGGNLAVGAGNLEIFSPVAGNVNLAANALTLGSRIDLNLTSIVKSLNLISGASIGGDLNYWSNRLADISTEATVSGKITRNLPSKSEFNQESFAAFWSKLAAGYNIVSFLSALILGLLLIFFFPNFTQKVAATISLRPWLCLGLGLITFLLAPLFILICIITIIGIPIALILLTAYLFLIFLGKILASIFIGQKAIGYINQKTNPYISFMFGLMILTGLGLIPLLGWLIKFAAILFGIGAYLLIKKEIYHSLSLKKII